MNTATIQVKKDIREKIVKYLNKEFPYQKLIYSDRIMPNFKSEIYGTDGIKVRIQEIGGKIYYKILK